MKLSKANVAKAALAAMAATVVTTSAAIPASAAIVCNRWHECWHVRNHYRYPTRVGVVYHREGWRAPHHYSWRHDRFDHGYYRHGHWYRY